MKKRLISMLMAVLMIASLLPASAVFAAETTATECKHETTKTVKVQDKDTEKKLPGIEAVVCTECGEVTDVTITRFKEDSWLIKCKHKTNKVVEVQKVACEQFGLTVSYCADCGYEVKVKELAAKEGETAYFKGEKAIAHNFSDFHVEVKPVCNNDGWGYVVCKLCGKAEYIANAKDAKEYVKANTYLSTAEYNSLYIAVTNMFTRTNDDKHSNESVLIPATAGMTDKDGNALTPKSTGTHQKTINGKVLTQNKNTGAYEATTVDVVKDYTGDLVCPDCGFVKKGHSETHTFIVTTEGSYTHTNGSYSACKSDIGTCDKCKYTGGERIYAPASSWVIEKAVSPTCEKAGSWELRGKLDSNDKLVKYYVNNNGTVVENGVRAALGHNWVTCGTKNATCTEPGKIYTALKQCSICGKYKDGDKVIENPENAAGTDIPARGHHFDEVDIVAATCNQTGFAVKKCSEPGCNAYELQANGEYGYETAKKTKHVASDKLANVKEATCTEEGYTGDVVCKFCGEVMKPGEKTKMVDHTPVAVEAKAPTCTEPGISKGTVCKVCEKVLSGQETVPALGHDPKLVNAKDATCTEAGYSGDKVCTRCNVTLEKGKDIKALGHNFVKGVCSRCDAKQTGYNPFSDVKSTDRFYSDIMWAWENGIVEGDNTGMFRADGKLTRAQVVTMLWRMNDKPTAKNAATFTDLTQDWYKAAVAWAVEKGIVNGVGNNKFAPNETCTRAQIVTMLWRLDGEKKVTPTINFTDLTQNWYKDAVAWAANNGITKGDGAGHFYPANDCTRGEAVAFIHRTAMLGK